MKKEKSVLPQRQAGGRDVNLAGNRIYGRRSAHDITAAAPRPCGGTCLHTHKMTQPLPPPVPAPGSTRETESVTTTPPLPDISEAVRARVAQRLQGAPDSFLLTDEDSPSDEDTSLRKRKRTMKSGKLRTQDTHVVIRIKWPHEVVCSAFSKAPVYEELLLASFTNGYLGIVAEEKGSTVGEVMLIHLWALWTYMDGGWYVTSMRPGFSSLSKAGPRGWTRGRGLSSGALWCGASPLSVPGPQTHLPLRRRPRGLNIPTHTQIRGWRVETPMSLRWLNPGIGLALLITGGLVKINPPIPLICTFVPIVSGWLSNCAAIQRVGAIERQHQQKTGMGGCKITCLHAHDLYG